MLREISSPLYCVFYVSACHVAPLYELFANLLLCPIRRRLREHNPLSELDAAQLNRYRCPIPDA